MLRIRLRGILLATFWMAVCLGCFSAIARAHAARESMALEVPLTYLMMVCPFIASGALVGRTLMGAVVGVMAISLFWIVFLLT